MFTVRAAAAADLGAVVAIARHLDSVNLPNDPERLAQIIERSEKSLAGRLDPARREIMLVLAEDGPDRAERLVGASLIFAKHGSRQAPHVYFDVLDEERYSDTLDRHFRHTVLRIGYNYRGMTEVGGLVLLPELRGRPERLGTLLSYARFLYIGLHRADFCDDMVSELMPPLEPDGTSLLWEALGRHFTGLSYQEADRLSRENKEFIRSLFPQDPIYAALLPAGARALIGQVGPSSRAVERMLRRIGFSYAHRIDPFDGGPHFHAKADDVALIKGARRIAVSSIGAEGTRPGAAPVDALVAVKLGAPPFFRAASSRVRLGGDGVELAPAVALALGVQVGQQVGLVAIPSERRERSED